MESLIPIYNSLEEILSSVDLTDTIELVRIVVIGSQSAGKSSVLESIAGIDFLPRGAGLVTRCPIVMQCIKSKNKEPYAVFSHKEGPFKDFKEVRKEIMRRTNELAGDDRKIVESEIRLTIYSEDVVNLTLVDLPGLINVTEENQNENTPKLIRKLVKKFIKKDSTIILAITPATDDVANSAAIKLAKKYDKEGKRTLGVLTKVDLMDKGTNVLKLLKGEEFKLKHGYVAVKGRSQQDIKDDKTIKDAQKDETEYFQKSEDYSDIARYQGIKHLKHILSKLLTIHICERLTKIK